MAKTKKTEEQKRLEREIESILKKKDVLVSERLRMEIRNRIIEREMNKLSNELNDVINRIVETKPTLTKEEYRVATINKGRAVLMLRQRLPDLPMDAARDMVDRAMGPNTNESTEN